MYEITLYIERNKIICDQLHNALTQEAYILFWHFNFKLKPA